MPIYLQIGLLVLLVGVPLGIAGAFLYASGTDTTSRARSFGDAFLLHRATVGGLLAAVLLLSLVVNWLFPETDLFAWLPTGYLFEESLYVGFAIIGVIVSGLYRMYVYGEDPAEVE